MHEKVFVLSEFDSAAGKILEEFVKEKIACGYSYTTRMKDLCRFDRFLLNKNLDQCELPQELVLEWLRKRSNESRKTQRIRFNLIQQFAKFMANRGYRAYIPDSKLAPVVREDFAPYIFTHEQVQKIFAETDLFQPSPLSPYRHIIMPELFRIIYGCGLRIDEALKLTLANTDLKEGILIIRKSKFDKDRFVPMAPELTGRLRAMLIKLGNRNPKSYLFPSPDESRLNRNTIGEIFRGILLRCSIAHGGRGKGPRIHDLRHTFAVHRLAKWYREKVDFDVKLSVLAAYMGHKDIVSTQQYLHLTLELATDLSVELENRFGDIIPRRRKNETN